MASILKVDTIQDQSGNNIINENADTITIGASGDTVTIPSGATLSNSGTLGSGMGKVLQVVQETFTSTFNTTSTSYVATGISASITPFSTSSKILILCNYVADNLTADDQYGTIFRGATNLGGSTQDGLQRSNATTSGRLILNQSISYLDSPSSVSSLTYELYAKLGGSGNVQILGNATTCTIQLLEIAG